MQSGLMVWVVWINGVGTVVVVIEKNIGTPEVQKDAWLQGRLQRVVCATTTKAGVENVVRVAVWLLSEILGATNEAEPHAIAAWNTVITLLGHDDVTAMALLCGLATLEDETIGTIVSTKCFDPLMRALLFGFTSAIANHQVRLELCLSHVSRNRF